MFLHGRTLILFIGAKMIYFRNVKNYKIRSIPGVGSFQSQELVASPDLWPAIHKTLV
jgi:hypothetical protein